MSRRSAPTMPRPMKGSSFIDAAFPTCNGVQLMASISGSLRTFAPRRYDGPVPMSLFEDMKLYVGFDDSDAALLAKTKQSLASVLPEIVDVFYDTLTRHPRARLPARNVRRCSSG